MNVCLAPERTVTFTPMTRPFNARSRARATGCIRGRDAVSLSWAAKHIEIRCRLTVVAHSSLHGHATGSKTSRQTMHNISAVRMYAIRHASPAATHNRSICLNTASNLQNTRILTAKRTIVALLSEPFADRSARHVLTSEPTNDAEIVRPMERHRAVNQYSETSDTHSKSWSSQCRVSTCCSSREPRSSALSLHHPKTVQATTKTETNQSHCVVQDISRYKTVL